MARNLARAVAELAVLETRTGRRIQLALEPEPDCIWDTAADCARLFNEELPELADIPESRIQRHLGVCLDTCHQAVIFDSPTASLQQLIEAGVPVAKVQVSAAPIFPCTIDGLAQAETFVDACYLHQTAIRLPDHTVRRFADLPEAIAAARQLPESSQLRTHFHIPLCVESWETMQSTRRELDSAFWQLASKAGITQFEAETYTFDVLPSALRQRSVAENVAAELRWMHQALGL